MGFSHVGRDLLALFLARLWPGRGARVVHRRRADLRAAAVLGRFRRLLMASPVPLGRALTTRTQNH